MFRYNEFEAPDRENKIIMRNFRNMMCDSWYIIHFFVTLIVRKNSDETKERFFP